ncbi:L-aspartate oxidase [Microbacterium horticulturae]|uniref:L-aspartate oxidase n=1 Tax=Microbacterium horticulturae TaxID=3028316 RepID=A0ABY8BXH1_9MICO|nr:L-aspartate oxidase [Microbacterium sp. KACC 23027]WEG07546.1 L-aspartate oxidase [Microbacterium sp. KACC 23027]
MTSVVVVGAGIAGITAALHAEANGCAVTLVTKAALGESATTHAQGGIAAVTDPADRFADHVHDTVAAGAAVGDLSAIRALVGDAPARIDELVSAGVAFDRNADGSYVQGLEAAHSFPRILHAGGDATGREIERALVERLRASGVRILEHAYLVELVTSPDRVTGVELLVAGSPALLPADAVVLATGGAGQLYAHTTNPSVATGDGIAAALRAGAAAADLEFVQFHPTVLAAGTPFLVSEAVRGEGAVLLDEHGHRFAFDAHPDGELAPRDVVARAVARTMAQQDGRPVLLDATGIGAGDTSAFLARRFPTIDAAVRARGLDWAREPIPVTPAAHYLMGGVRTDLAGRTTLPGMYAVGECARTGVHGANRLASNSLLEGAVFGARCGDAIAADAASHTWPAVVPQAATAPVAPLDDAAPFTRAALQELMWADAGLVRDAAGLAHAASTIAAWRAQPRAPRTVHEHEDENLLQLAAAVVAAASTRRSSLGAHFRRDEAAFGTHPEHDATAPIRREPLPSTADQRSSARILQETR